MLNLNVVSCAGSFSHNAVHMLSLCVYYNLCGVKDSGADKVVGASAS